MSAAILVLVALLALIAIVALAMCSAAMLEEQRARDEGDEA